MTGASSTAFGSLYVLLFADGLVKVGRAARAEPRVAQHCAEGARHSNPATRYWISTLIAELPTAERELIEWCARRRGARLVSGTEWFHGVRYERVVARAVELVEPRAISAVTGRRLHRVESYGVEVEVAPAPLAREVPVAERQPVVTAPVGTLRVPRDPSGVYAFK